MSSEIKTTLLFLLKCALAGASLGVITAITVKLIDSSFDSIVKRFYRIKYEQKKVIMEDTS